MNRFTNIILSVAALLAFSACTKNFEEINTNPNGISYGDIQAYNCFEPILYGVGSKIQEQAQYYNNELIQMSAFTAGQTQHIKEYIITGGNCQTLWDTYARYGGDSNHMIELARKWDDPYYEALGLIFKVYNLSILSSLFGDIPYKEAYKYSENRTPAFESQEELLSDLIEDLDSASVILLRKPTQLKTGLDAMYNDNMTKWAKFANSLRMRLLCRYSGIASLNCWSRIQEMIDNPEQYPVMSSNDENATVPFQNQDPYMSYWGTSKPDQSSFQNYRFSERVISMMVQFNSDGHSIFVDPRLQMFGKYRNGEWKGAVSGCPASQNSTADVGTSYVSYDFMCRADFPSFLMEYSEILFIEAEGVAKGVLSVEGKTAKELYEDAMEANIEKWRTIGAAAPSPKTIKASDLEKLLASPLASWDAVADGTSIYKSEEELILSQKYLSLYYCGFEQYNEWRRTEYPILTIGSGTDSNDYELPTRFAYPNYTATSNKLNVQKALERMGGDDDMHTALDWSYKKLSGGQHRNPYKAQ